MKTITKTPSLQKIVKAVNTPKGELRDKRFAKLRKEIDDIKREQLGRKIDDAYLRGEHAGYQKATDEFNASVQAEYDKRQKGVRFVPELKRNFMNR